MEYSQENNEKTTKESGFSISLRDVIELIIANWYWFTLSVFICVSVTYLYTRTLVPIYRHQTVMLVKGERRMQTRTFLLCWNCRRCYRQWCGK